ncbi:hypothetical protein Gpo141_00004972 [Globisporangium polare]
MSADKPQLSVVVLGHIDAGKSTTMGHLLFKTGGIDQKTMHKCELMAGAAEKPMCKFAWVLDTLKAERVNNRSVNISLAKFETPTYVLTMIDAPGHHDYVKNMIKGTVLADAALLVVAAGEEEFEEQFAPMGQLREHALLAFTLGVKQLVVAVNKMDCEAVAYSEERFNAVKSRVKSYLKKVGFNTSASAFVPISGWLGDNLTDKSDAMPWYDGACLVDALETLSVPRRAADKPLRITIGNVLDLRHRDVGTIVVGRVETGVLVSGSDVTFGPGNITAEVGSIERHGQRLTEARPGDHIGFTIKDMSSRGICRGWVGSDARLDPAKRAIEFTAQVVVLNAPGLISAGYTPMLHCHTARVACRFSKITEKIDRQTGEVVELNPESVKTGDACTVVFTPTKPMVVEAFQQYPQLGRFVIRDARSVVAVGVIKSVVKSDERVAKKKPVSASAAP